MKKTFIIGTLLLVMSGRAYAYSDIDNSVCKAEIDRLSAYTIISGYEDGTFKPKSKVSRAEVGKMLAVAMGYGKYDTPSEKHSEVIFTDFTQSHWAYPYIQWLNNIAGEVISGFEDDSFRADDSVTVAQLTKIAILSHGNDGYVNYVDEALGYPQGYINVGKEYGFLDGIDLSDIDRDITREEAAKIIYNTITIPVSCSVGYSDINGDGEVFWNAQRVILDGNNRFSFTSFETYLQNGNWISEPEYITINPLDEDDICTVLGEVINVDGRTAIVRTNKIHAHDGGLYLPDDKIEVSLKVNENEIETGEFYCFVVTKDKKKLIIDRCCIIR